LGDADGYVQGEALTPQSVTQLEGAPENIHSEWRITMTGKNCAFGVSLMAFLKSLMLMPMILMSIIGVESLYGASPKNNPSDHIVSANSGSTSQSTPDITGTWSGSFQARHVSPAVVPFTMTVVITSDSNGHLVGDASLVSHCLKSHRLHVAVKGSDVVLGGTDADGDNATFRGTLDKTGTLLTLKYLINGSASGRCEIEGGTGNLSKR
jgi:hypothetical protein